MSSNNSSSLITVNINSFHQQSNTPKKTRNVISKYEKTRLIATRALQIENNSAIFTDISSLAEKDPISIAIKEYNEKKLPLGIRRILPDGNVEDVFIKDVIES